MKTNVVCRIGAGLIAVASATGCNSAGWLDVGTDQAPDGAAGLVLDATAGDAAPSFLTVTIAVQSQSACGTCVALTARVAGGTGPYTYLWSPGVSGDGGVVEACPSVTTTYTVTVTDSSGRAGELSTSTGMRSAAVTVSVPASCDAGATDGPAGDAGAYVYWTDWQSGDGGVVLGLVSPPAGTIQVTYVGEVSGLQTTTGTNEFTPAATFTSATVADSPPGPGMIEVWGTAAQSDIVTFSEPVTNPVIAIYDLGTSFAGMSSTIDFGEPFVVLSSGPNAGGAGYWGSETFLPADGGISGVGANGVVELEGTFTSIQWTNPADTPYASYTGVTVGVRGAP